LDGKRKFYPTVVDACRGLMREKISKNTFKSLQEVVDKQKEIEDKVTSILERLMQ
jgi:uncharacterized protein YaaN involved in tellurite resistance